MTAPRRWLCAPARFTIQSLPSSRPLTLSRLPPSASPRPLEASSDRRAPTLPQVFTSRVSSHAARSPQPTDAAPRAARLRYAGGVLLIAVLYFLGAQLGAYLAFVERSVTPVWPPSGIALGMLLLLGVRYWPGVALAILLETIVGSASPLSMVLISIGNTAVAVGSAVVLQRWTLGQSPLASPDGALRLIIVALLGPVVGAGLGVIALWAGDGISSAAILNVWRVWWLGDVLGVLLFAPFILAWARPDVPNAPWRTRSFWMLLGGLIVLGALVFRVYVADAVVEYPLAYAIIPLVLWMTLRHGHRGGTLATMLVAGIAILATVRGHGALARDEMQESLLLVATFCSVMAATALLVGATVAERRRTEEQMRQTQKLESLGVLAGGIAHDFNNLLAGILGNVGIAKAEVEEGDDPGESLANIETAARRAADLTRQMLAYSGRGAFVIQRIDLSALVTEMAHLLSSAISKKAVLRLHTLHGLPSCEGDATQLRQVVMNLITNASDALGDAPGTITVTTGVLQATRADLASTYIDERLPEGEYVFLEVADTGCGMDDETRARIFDPFFTTKFTGRGLGLAATLGIVRGHRGAIGVESAPGRGTTIRLLLPVSAPPAAVEAPKVPAAPEPGVTSWKGTGRILVVDDEELVRSLASRVLEASGFEVVGATDGLEALEVFERSPDSIRLVLLDWMMPRLSGAETLDALRERRADLPVILSSGYAEQTVSGRLDDRLTVFIQKPYRPQELLAKVKAALA